MHAKLNTKWALEKQNEILLERENKDIKKQINHVLNQQKSLNFT